MNRNTQRTKDVFAELMGQAVKMILIWCCTLAAFSIGLMRVDAADGYTSILDPDRTGTLTIIKLLENGRDGAVSVGTGTTQEIGVPGMKGISFAALRIAKLESGFLTDGQGGKTYSAYYTELDAGFTSLYKKVTGEELSLQAVYDGSTEGYRAETIEEAVKTIRACGGDGQTWTGETALQSLAAEGQHLSLTDQNGKTTATKLPLGLYLIAEDETANKYQAAEGTALAGACSPFLVALPMTNLTAIGAEPEGSLWQYDVTVYPKNNTVSVEKYAVLQSDGDTLTKTDSAEIGKVFTQVLIGEAPVTASMEESGKLYKKYILSDEMSAGLSFDKVQSVRIGKLLYAPEKASDFDGYQRLETADYTVETQTTQRKFSVSLTESGLEKLNQFGADAMVVVFFESHLNKTAEISENGTADNENHPSLCWQLYSGLEKNVSGTPVHHYTYALELQKTGIANPEKTGFSISAKDGEKLHFIKEQSGIWHVRTSEEEEGITEITPNTKGVLKIRGLDAAAYTLTETATETGYSLLKSSIDITLTAPPTPNGNLEKAAASVEGKTANLVIKNGGVSGVAELTIENQKQIQLKTGAEGSGGILMAGLSVLLGIGIYGLLLLLQKRRDER